MNQKMIRVERKGGQKGCEKVLEKETKRQRGKLDIGKGLTKKAK